jgi:hypothetical protein
LLRFPKKVDPVGQQLIEEIYFLETGCFHLRAFGGFFSMFSIQKQLQLNTSVAHR